MDLALNSKTETLGAGGGEPFRGPLQLLSVNMGAFFAGI